ncbi:CHAP domain-containing protein [Candidatus Saccharibacteria bacterium]|nr:CHAP domain-containing protein [Candidatus Saccharibacteria bacterium]
MKNKNTTILKYVSKAKLPLLGFISIAIIGLVAAPLVNALTAQETAEREKLQRDIQNQSEAKDELTVEASSISEAVSELEAQIAVLQNQINESQNRIDDLEKQINKAQAELEKQKEVLGENIRAVYLEGQISTLEMLASSKDLSEFVDKQQYRNSVQEKIKNTLEKITDLKFQLRAQKDEVEKYLKDQETARDKVAGQRSEQKRLLSLNKSEQASLNAKIKSNSARVAALNAKQVEENRRAYGGNLPSGIPGGGGYKYGNATCLWPGYADPPCREYDWGYPSSSSPRNLYDEWGYGYRNCTSWAAFRVVQVMGYTPPGLTQLGHAKSWPYNTSATVNSNPSGGRATVAVSGGTYGHVRFVEAVNSDGSVRVSDYNFGGDGIYRNYTLSAAQASYLTYIHF